MDVASGPLSQHDRRSRTGGVRIVAMSAQTLLTLAALCLLLILAVTIASLPQEPVSEPVLVAPLRWA